MSEKTPAPAIETYIPDTKEPEAVGFPWEVVHRSRRACGGVIRTHETVRREVPGGWIYFVTDVIESPEVHTATSSAVFVPAAQPQISLQPAAKLCGECPWCVYGQGAVCTGSAKTAG